MFWDFISAKKKNKSVPASFEVCWDSFLLLCSRVSRAFGLALSLKNVHPQEPADCSAFKAGGWHDTCSAVAWADTGVTQAEPDFGHWNGE